MGPVRTAIVVGGGVAGPVAAIALQKAGIDATVYEAQPTGAEGEGSFLTLASNGIDALRVLDADQLAVQAGFPTLGITLRNSKGKHLGESRTGGVLPDGTTSHTIKRSDLYAALFGEACSRDLTLLHGRRLVDATEESDGVRARFADGSEASADLLVGADGLHSTVRTLIDARAPRPVYSGLLTVGGYAHGVAVDAEPGSYEMIFGRKAFFGYAVAPDGEVWWFANIPQRKEPARGELEQVTPVEWRGRLLALFADDAGPATALILATANLSPVTAIHTVPHLPAWNRGRMVVVGDAAHAPSPSSGQGASLSIEDAVVLARSLRGANDPAAALAGFAAARRPRVERIIRWAARMNSSKAAGPVGAAVRDAMMPALMRMAARSKANQAVFDYHIDWDEPLAH